MRAWSLQRIWLPLCLAALATSSAFAQSNSGRTANGAEGDQHVDFVERADFALEVDAASNAQRSGRRFGFAWPELDSRCTKVPGCTLLLEVDVGSTRERPRFLISADGHELEQWLAPGRADLGRRWLEVSALVDLPSGARVEVAAYGLRQQTLANRRLVGWFAPTIDSTTRVLVVAPHPDDAEIAAFGIYANTDADVLTVTAGDAGGFNYRALVSDAQEHYRLKGELRTWDSIVVPRLGGVIAQRARNLGYYDATLQALWRRRPETVPPAIASVERPDVYRELNVDEVLRSRPMESSWPSLVEDLRAEVARVEPEILVAPHPFLDAHGDHQYTTIALLEALELLEANQHQADWRPPLLLLYTNHMVGAEPWPWGPRSARIGPPPFDAVTARRQLEFDALLSWPLSPSDVARKILALEMMHDLRPLDLQEPKRPRELWREALRATARSWSKQEPDYSYLRRAPRPNELFFVLDLEEAQKMRARFLQQASTVRR